MVKGVRPIVFRVRRGLEVPVSDLPPTVDRALRRNFEHRNPEYEKRSRMGLWLGDTPATISNYEVHDGVLVLPRGATSKVRSVLDSHGYEEDSTWWFEDERHECDPVDISIGDGAEPIEAREYQVGIVEAIKRRENCLIRAGTGCLDGDTLIGVHRAGKSFNLPIRELVHRFNGGEIEWGFGKAPGKLWDLKTPTLVRARSSDGYVRLQLLGAAISSGIRELFEVTVASGRTIRATADHRFLTPDGWKRLSRLTTSDMLIEEAPTPAPSPRVRKNDYKVVGGLRSHPHARKTGGRVLLHRLVVEASTNSISIDDYIRRLRSGKIQDLRFLDPGVHVHHRDEDPKNNALTNLVVYSPREHHAEHGRAGGWKRVTASTGPVRIIKIERVGKRQTFDLTMAGEPRNYLANGLVVHNSGKTEAIILSIRELRQPTLIVVWSKGLVRQWVERICLRFGWAPDEVGSIEGSRRRIRPVTVAMQQTLYNGAQDIVDQFGYVVLDEVQRAAARTVREVVSMFPARYRVGVSADERRKDRLEFLIHDAFGDVAIEIPKEELIERGDVCEVEIVVVPTGFSHPPYENAPPGQRSLLYKRTIDAIVGDAARAELAAKLVARRVLAGDHVLAFSDRVDHCKDISRLISLTHGVPCGLFLGGPRNRQLYEETLERLAAGRVRCAVGTSCVYQGVDIPRLTAGVVTTPTATNRQLLEQQVGRLRRPFPGKRRGTLYYLWDERLFPTHVDLLRRWYGKRLVRVAEPIDLGIEG